jgi:hypothetical protein
VARPTGAVRLWQRARPAAMAHRSRPLSALWSTKHNEVFTYDIGAMWGTQLAQLVLTAGDGGG